MLIRSSCICTKALMSHRITPRVQHESFSNINLAPDLTWIYKRMLSKITKMRKSVESSGSWTHSLKIIHNREALLLRINWRKLRLSAGMATMTRKMNNWMKLFTAPLPRPSEKPIKSASQPYWTAICARRQLPCVCTCKNTGNKGQTSEDQKNQCSLWS